MPGGSANNAVLVCFVGWFLLACAQAQEPGKGTPGQEPVVAEPELARVVLQTDNTASGLRLMKFSGVLPERAGNARTGAVGLTFALYKDQQGGSPLWLEVHNAQLDDQGRYTVLLGSTKSEGLPLELFSSGEARWLGVQLNLPGEEEQPRVLLVSVPYALKAADAETLGGKPPSAFLPAESQARDSTVKSGKAESERSKEAVAERPDRVYSHMAGYIPKYTSPGVLNDTTAPIFENGTNIGIGTTDPSEGGTVNSKLTIRQADAATGIALMSTTGAPRFALNPNADGSWTMYDGANSTWNRGVSQKSGNVGIGTAAPGARLAVTGAGTGDARFGDPGCGGNYTGIWLNQLTADCSNYNFTSSPGDQTLYVNRPAGAGIEFREGNAAQMVVKAGGNVGIGTTAPNTKLSLGTDITAQKLALYDGAGDFYGLGVQGGRIVFHTGNTEKMAITTAGNVGIGTAVPGQKLTVAGTIESTSGGFKFPDGSLQTTAAGSLAFISNGDLARLKEQVKEQELQIKNLRAEVEALKARLEALLSAANR